MNTLMMNILEPIMYQGEPILDVAGLLDLICRFSINVAVVWTIVHFFYYPKSKRRDYYFTFILVSVSIFMLIYFMEGAKLKTGAALGLFAIFGIIRYRTEAMPIREMTYLFFLISLSVINGMAEHMSLLEFFIPNFIFLGISAVFESKKVLSTTASKFILYDNIELIHEEKRSELIADLEKRTGLKINRVEVGAIDFLKDSAILRIYYKPTQKSINSIDHLAKMPKQF